MTVDWAAMERRYAFHPALVERLVQLVLQGHSDDGEQLRALASQRDLAGIERLAHALKSVGGNVCAPAVQALAARTMDCARRNEQAAFAHAQELAGAVDRMIEALSEGRRS